MPSTLRSLISGKGAHGVSRVSGAVDEMMETNVDGLVVRANSDACMRSSAVPRKRAFTRVALQFFFDVRDSSGSSHSLSQFLRMKGLWCLA